LVEPAAATVTVVPGYDDLLQEAETTLDRVDAVLARLADHSYGSCRQCGAAIGEERLTVAPTTEVCALHDA
jgi:DnaK suppressor protein